MVKWLYDWEPLTLGNHAANFVVNSSIVVEIKRFWFATWSKKTTCLKGCLVL